MHCRGSDAGLIRTKDLGRGVVSLGTPDHCSAMNAVSSRLLNCVVARDTISSSGDFTDKPRQACKLGHPFADASCQSQPPWDPSTLLPLDLCVLAPHDRLSQLPPAAEEHNCCSPRSPGPTRASNFDSISHQMDWQTTCRALAGFSNDISSHVGSASKAHSDASRALHLRLCRTGHMGHKSRYWPS
jgi:hypothetical protein